MPVYFAVRVRVEPDAVATTSCDGVRWPDCPRLTASRSAVARAALAAVTVADAAASVPSVTRTSRKLFAPWRAAAVTAVSRSNLRAWTVPNRRAASAGPPAMAGLLTGPQVAVPTTPKMLVGTPLIR